VIVVIATSLDTGGGDSGSGGGSAPAGKATRAHGPTHTPKSYVVENGDTLTSIAHKTGVPVATILELNPGIDPQILISGERLKLK
jgi:LysM repeat protein